MDNGRKVPIYLDVPDCHVLSLAFSFSFAVTILAFRGADRGGRGGENHDAPVADPRMCSQSTMQLAQKEVFKLGEAGWIETLLGEGTRLIEELA